MELLATALLPYNLPVTALLGLVLLYWIGVIVGALDIELLDFDLDFDSDAHGFGLPFLRFLGLGDIPVMVWISAFFLILWVLSVLANAVFNPMHLTWLGGLILLPNSVVSVLATAAVTAPLRPMFRKFESETSVEIVGSLCTIVSGSVDENTGHAEIPGNGAPVMINVRTRPGISFHKGDRCLIVEKGTKEGTYIIEEFNEWT